MSETTTLIQRLLQSGLSQSEIARRTGIPQPRISRWAGGEVPASADDALKLRALVEQGAPAVEPSAQEAAPATAAQG